MVLIGVTSRLVPMDVRLIEMEPGGWLAVTGPDAPVSMGEFGATEEEARQRLAVALRAREELHAEASTDS